MFDFVHSNKRIIQVILALIFLPFAFFGVDSYFRSDEYSDSVATVGGQPIGQQEFTRALQQRQVDLQRMIGNQVDASLLDNPEVRFAVLDSIIRQRLLVNQAVRDRLLVSDQQLQDIIGEQPAFQSGGKFSHDAYEELLQRQNLTPVTFENSLRRDLMVSRLGDAYRNTSIVPNQVVERVLRLNGQQRETSQSVIDPSKFASQVKVEDSAVKEYYSSHQKEFQVPEQARIEYVLLSLDSLASQVDVAPDEVRQFYEQNTQRYAKGEERRASHILITVDAKASAQDKEAARAKAEQLLKQVKANPAGFGELAKKNSQDPGSAAKGGDLGFFVRGAMLKPFDDAVFNMKEGEIAGPVETQYGYHIIRLTTIKGQGFNDVKAQIERDLKRQKAGKRFSELAEQLRDKAFEESDSLKPAADTLKLQIQTSGWLSRDGSDNKLLSNPKLLQAVFSEDAIANKRNTEVIDVGDNNLVAARVIEHKPSAVRPFEDVSAEIAKRLTSQQADQLAAKSGRELLTKLKQGAEVRDLGWDAGKLVSRENTQGYSAAALNEIFKVDTGKLPAYAGVERPQGGYVLLKITRVQEPESIDNIRHKSASEQLQQLMGQEELNAYMSALKVKTDVKIHQDKLEKKEQ